MMSKTRSDLRLAFLALSMAAAGLAPAPVRAEATTEGSTPTVVHVEPGQTLNAAIADVDGPVMVILPAGVTEHDKAITRSATVIVKGQGEHVSTLRPSASLSPEEGVALIRQTEPFDGDLILSDFTYDRAWHPAESYEDLEVGGVPGPTHFYVAAGGRVIWRNVAMHHFNFGTGIEKMLHGRFAFFNANHQKEIRFENLTVDFKKGGGIRRRPGARSFFLRAGDVDRFVMDRDCLIRGHLCQDANPEHTVGEVWRNRGNAGTFQVGLSMRVHESAYIDGEWHDWDYGASRSVEPVQEDAVIEWRADLINAGYGDQFWQGRAIDGGHMIFKDVRLVGNRTGELWNDYGLRAHGNWKTITVDNCIVINRGHPLSFPSSTQQGLITIRNTTLAPVGGGGPGLLISAERIAGLNIDGLHVFTDLEADEEYHNSSVRITETGEGGGLFTIHNVHAQGYLYNILDLNVGSETTVHTSNIHGTQITPDTLVEDAEPVAVLPQENRSLVVDGNPEPLDFEPIATIEDFSGTEPFSRIDFYLAFDSGPGVFGRVVVGGIEKFGNAHQYPDRLYRGDAIQFFITRGRPGEVVGGTLWDIARHDEHGLTAYRRNFWPDQDLPTGVIDVPLAIEYHEDEQEIVYEFMLPWEEIGLPGPWYEDLCVDLVVADGQAYGAHYKGAAWENNYEGIGHSIFHSVEPRSRGAKWIRFRAPSE